MDIWTCNLPILFPYCLLQAPRKPTQTNPLLSHSLPVVTSLERFIPAAWKMACLPAILWIEPTWFKLQTVNMTYDSPFSTKLALISRCKSITSLSKSTISALETHLRCKWSAQSSWHCLITMSFKNRDYTLCQCKRPHKVSSLGRARLLHLEIHRYRHSAVSGEQRV